MAQILLNVVRNGVYIATLDGQFYNDLDIWGSLQTTVIGMTDGMYYSKGNVPFGVANTDAVNVSQLNSLASSMSSNMSSLQTTQGNQATSISNLNSQVAGMQSNISNMIVVGDLKHSAQTTDHGKWLLCDGRAISRSTYAGLFSVLGTAHGSGDGTSTFNLPNPAGRSLLTSGQGTTIEGGGNGTNRLRGSIGGVEAHALTIAEMPAHSHTYTNQTVVSDASISLLGNGNRVSASPVTNTSTVGSGNAHSLMNPFIVVGSVFIYTG